MIVVKEYFTNNTVSDFGIWLKTWRESFGWSYRVLAEKINNVCTFGYLQQLETGKKGKKGHSYQPDIEIVEALAVAFNRPVDEARLAAGIAPASSGILPIEISAMNFTVFNNDEIKEIARHIQFMIQLKGNGKINGGTSGDGAPEPSSSNEAQSLGGVLETEIENQDAMADISDDKAGKALPRPQENGKGKDK